MEQSLEEEAEALREDQQQQAGTVREIQLQLTQYQEEVGNYTGPGSLVLLVAFVFPEDEGSSTPAEADRGERISSGQEHTGNMARH